MKNPNKSTKRLIDACLKNKQGAWDKFVQEFSGIVIWSIKSRLTKIGYPFIDKDIEDIYQQTFLHIWENNSLADIKDVTKTAAWLYSVSAHVAIDYIRKVKGYRYKDTISIYEEIPKSDDKTQTVADNLISETPLPSEEIEKKDLKEYIDNILSRLSPREKLVMSLYYVSENSLNEISQQFGLSVGVIGSIIHRAKEKLKRWIDPKNI